MVVTKAAVKHLPRNVAALMLEMVLDWKFLWQLSCFAHVFEVFYILYYDDYVNFSPSGSVAIFCTFLLMQPSLGNVSCQFDVAYDSFSSYAGVPIKCILELPLIF